MALAVEIDYAGTVARAVRMINLAGCMDMNGHVSMRDGNDPETMWINSRKASRSTLTAHDIVTVDLRTGTRIGAGDEPPSECHIHREIYLRRPDVHAIEHSHPEYIVTLSIAGRALQPVFAPAAFLPEKTPIYPASHLINTVERGARVAELLADNPAVTLRGHGLVVAAPTVESLVMWVLSAEDNAKAQFNASQLGDPIVMTTEERESQREELADPKIPKKFWDYWFETAERRGAFAGVDG